MDKNRVKLDIQGTEYTFPINPIEYHNLDDYEVKSKQTVDGGLLRFSSNFDSRQRVMRWEDIPNSTEFNTMLNTMRSAIGLSGVRINHRGLSIYENEDYWKAIRIDDVAVFIQSDADYKAISKLKYDIEMRFSYIKTTQSITNALFTFQPNDYANASWIQIISGWAGGFHTIVCHPNLGPLNTTALRGAFPTAKLLVYTNAQEMQMNGTGAAYNQALRAAITGISGHLATFLSPPAVAGDQIKAFDGGVGRFECAMHKEIADAFIPIIVNNVNGVYNGFEYDGVYMDMYTPDIPIQKIAYYTNFITISGHVIDFDGDGVGETLDEARNIYIGGKSYLISGLREELPDKIIIANAGGGSFHSGLNGITLENVGERFTSSEAINYFRTQINLSKYSPKINIAWAVTPTASGLTYLFSSVHPEIYYGVMRDGFVH